ncbi:PLP-dependent transferase [Mesorhizobium amorphae]|uniref:PLP-dependent transferase n=1 Tax=Mesorhizobium amorphae TaxID=71433 RepID=UPI003D67E604
MLSRTRRPSVAGPDGPETHSSVATPCDCWLACGAHCEGAQKVAEALASHPRVEKVLFPDLQDDPGHDLATGK